MKVQIQFDIECGKTTCASEPGKFCDECKKHDKLTPGQTGTTSGFPATVVRQYDGNMYEVRTPGGLVCIDQSDFIAD